MLLVRGCNFQRLWMVHVVLRTHGRLLHTADRPNMAYLRSRHHLVAHSLGMKATRSPSSLLLSSTLFLSLLTSIHRLLPPHLSRVLVRFLVSRPIHFFSIPYLPSNTGFNIYHSTSRNSWEENYVMIWMLRVFMHEKAGTYKVITPLRAREGNTRGKRETVNGVKNNHILIILSFCTHFKFSFIWQTLIASSRTSSSSNLIIHELGNTYGMWYPTTFHFIKLTKNVSTNCTLVYHLKM